jgi:O-antigen ligase
VSGLVWQPQATRAAGLLRTRWVRVSALAAALLLLDVVIAVAVMDARFQRLLMLGLALVALALVFRFPFAATCAVLVLVAGVIEPGRFKLPVGPVELRLEELILGALIVVALLRPRRATLGGFPGWALITFLCVVCVSAYVALSSGRAQFTDVFQTVRLFAPLMLFFVVVRLFPEPGQVRRLLLAAVVIAAIGGVVALLVAAPGSGLATLLNPHGDSSIRSDEGLGLVNRVRLAGVVLAYALFWYTATRALGSRGAQRTGWLLALVGMAVAIVLSFNRNMWIGLVFGLFIMLAFSRGVTRRGLTVALVLLAAVGTTTVLAGTRIGTDSPIYPLVERGSTLFDPTKEAQDSSLQDRFVENRRAMAAIERHPVLGIGAGASFGSVGLFRTPSGAIVRQDALFMHNQYLYLLLIGGPLGLISFVAFLGVPVVEALRRRSDDALTALAAGVVITMLSAIVTMAFAHPTGSAVLALLTGALVVFLREPPGSVAA